MLIFNGKQYIEGIDGIDLLIQPDLYGFLNHTNRFDPINKLLIYSTVAKFPSNDPIYPFISKEFHYLHISGEYINPYLPLKEVIASAIYRLFLTRVFNFIDFKTFEKLNNISEDIIKDNLNLFVVGISGIEFCFDFPRSSVKINENNKIINVNDDDFISFLKMKLKDRQNCLIKDNTTYYSFDFNKRRKSTLKLYDREQWLLIKNNEYPVNFIKQNPYKLRLEFVLKRNYNTQYLTMNNIDGNYQQVIMKFIPYLAKLYRKYFFGKVEINTYNHPLFNIIYELANKEYIYNPKQLENISKEKIANKRSTNSDKFMKLYNILQNNKRKNDRLLEKLPDSYFVPLDRIIQNNSYNPFDMHNEEKILLKIDDEFIFLKNNYINPVFRTIDD